MKGLTFHVRPAARGIVSCGRTKPALEAVPVHTARRSLTKAQEAAHRAADEAMKGVQ